MDLRSQGRLTAETRTAYFEPQLELIALEGHVEPPSGGERQVNIEALRESIIYLLEDGTTLRDHQQAHLPAYTSTSGRFVTPPPPGQADSSLGGDYGEAMHKWASIVKPTEELGTVNSLSGWYLVSREG